MYFQWNSLQKKGKICHQFFNIGSLTVSFKKRLIKKLWKARVEYRSAEERVTNLRETETESNQRKSHKYIT